MNPHKKKTNRIVYTSKFDGKKLMTFVYFTNINFNVYFIKLVDLAPLYLMLTKVCKQKFNKSIFSRHIASPSDLSTSILNSSKHQSFFDVLAYVKSNIAEKWSNFQPT